MQDQWLRELQEQVKKDWKNYFHRRIDLTEARADEPILIPGEFIYVEERSSAAAVAQIKLNRIRNDALDLEKGVTIKTTFIKVFITNAALDSEWIDLIFGINFEYKKKIVSPEEIDAVLNFLLGGPITTPAGVNLRIVPGAGGITQIGDAGAASHGLVANDDFFVSGKFEVDGVAFFDAVSTFYNQLYMYNRNFIIPANIAFGYIDEYYDMEVLTIPVGQGAAGVVTVGNLARQDSTISALVCRVTQAPGGGATTIDIGRTGGGNLDEFIDGIATALGTTGTFAANHDAATTGPVLNAVNDTLTLTTDANVIGTDMKVRITTFYRRQIPPTS